MLTKDTAICIRAVDYSETSQIVTFFTRATGKISAIAKGSKRPKSAFDGPIEILSFGKIVFSDSTKEKLATLTEFQQQAFSTLPTNLFAFNCCLFAAELLNKLTHDYDPHPELFDNFLRFLQDVNEKREIPAYAGTGLPCDSIPSGLRRQGDEGRETLSLLILFQLTLLREIGLQPVLNYCVNCKSSIENQESRIKNQVYFSSSANGLICRDCEASFPDKIKLSRDAAACLTNLKQIPQSQDRTLAEIEEVLIHHFTELIGQPPKMGKYIQKT